MALPHVVILGGGFGGLTAAQRLAGAPVHITLIDRKNHHTFQPLLYQVATAALAAPDIAAPIRKILRSQKNTTVILDDALRVDVERKVVVLDHGGELAYDTLIVATGAVNTWYGHNAWEKVAPGLKTVEDAFEIRRRVLLAFERAEQERDPQKQAAWLTFTIIGGGPTGVELAGSIGEIARTTLARDFRNFDPMRARVVLIEGADRVLQTFTPDLSASAARQLESLGVQLMFNARVTDITDEGVALGERFVASRTVLWAAGVAGSPIGATLGAPVNRRGQVEVGADLSLPGHPEVFVIGDLAALTQDGQPVPGVAPAAMQGGAHVAEMIRRDLRHQGRQPFRYDDKGSLATIGRRRGVADFGRFTLTGTFAWLGWLFIHIFFLIGFRNRFVVMLEWGWAYLTYQRSARVILDEGATRSHS